MKLSFSITAKRNISLIVVILLTIVCCGSIASSITTVHSEGSISVCNRVAVSHSLLACAPTAARENSSGSSGDEQNLEKTVPSSDILSRIVRKLLVFLGCSYSSESIAQLRLNFLSICISAYAYHVLLTFVRFIHLIDGSK